MTAAQGVSLYWLDGEKVDIGNRGVQVAVPINGHLWERQEVAMVWDAEVGCAVCAVHG